MKLQKAVKRETARIALGVAVFTVLENIIYFLLGIWNTTVLGGSLVGAVLAIGNFFALALTVQAAAATGDEKRSKLKMQFSYSVRMLVVLLALIAVFAVPFLDGVSAIFPLLFPRLTIMAMQVMGVYKPEKQQARD